MIALILAACIPVLGFPTPTLQADHDRQGVTLYRIYAQRVGDLTWPWHTDIPYVAATTGPEAGGESAPSILQPWPIQRVVPTSVQNEDVRFVLKAVTAGNVESAPSNIITVCMPAIWQHP